MHAKDGKFYNEAGEVVGTYAVRFAPLVTLALENMKDGVAFCVVDQSQAE